MWSRTDPATLFGAAVTGWAGVRAAFEWPGRHSPTARPAPTRSPRPGPAVTSPTPWRSSTPPPRW